MLQNISKNFNFLFFEILFILLKLIYLQPTLQSKDFYTGINCKVIHIEQKIIYIIDDENNSNVFYYNLPNLSPCLNFPSYTSIKKIKDIIRIEERGFLIFGLDEGNQFCYKTYELSDNMEICLNLNFNLISYLKGKYINNQKFILYAIDRYDFKVFLLDYKTRQNLGEKIIPESKLGINVASFGKMNIECDSNDALHFICIFTYNSGDVYKLFYLWGEFGRDGNEIIGSICDKECFSGNIIKINNKFFACYQKKTGLLTIACQYFSYENNNILIENNKNIARVAADSNNKTTPLILYKYDNSILIQVDTKSSSNINSMLILTSLDLKINIQSNILSGLSSFLLKTISLINTDTYIYAIYEEGGSTKITGQKIKSCINDISINPSNNYINSSTKKTLRADFKTGHENEEIAFSLDSNTILYKANNEDEIFNNDFSLVTSNSFISLENENKQYFFFGKKDNSGVVNNFYCYASNRDDDFFQYFSLICPITITICHHSCETCTINKISSNQNHCCKSCAFGYHTKKIESGNDEYNCYDNTYESISNYYLNPADGYYYLCNNACKTCENTESCLTCSDGYYFMSSNGINIDYGLCKTSITKNYYLDHNANIVYRGINMILVYKPCYSTCFSCEGKGEYEDNNCLECIEGKKYIQYPYNNEQCTLNKEICLNDRKYWELKNNNIECIDNCERKIILYGDNRGQCVDDCKNFLNPYAKIENYYTLINCEGKSYCIPFETCLNGKFEVYLEEGECERLGPCEIDVFSNIDPFEHDNDPIPTNMNDNKPEEIMTKEEKINGINKRFKVLKIFTNDNNYTSYKKFDLFLIRDYIILLKKELENYNNNSEIYLITNTKYNNFTITLYPLDIEDFVYEQILSPNNLGFVNFTKTFSNFIEYEIDNKCLILVILLESHLTNSSINDLNYYLYSFDEQKDSGSLRNQIKIEQIVYLSNNNTQLEILYPLYNYYNETSEINERNSKILVDNIKAMNYKHPNIELYNLSDPFYNDICSLFTSEVSTDMTLNDRRNEYYVNISLCENDCFLIRILNKELKNPKSLCNCNIKTGFIFSNQSGIRDYIPQMASYNPKSFLCIKETFNKNSISSNVIFWIFLIVILFLIIMLIRWIFYGNKEIKRILNLYEVNQDQSKIHISIQSSGDIELIKNSVNKNNDNSKNNGKNNSKLDKKKDLAKSMALPDKKGKNYSNNEIESQKIEYLSAPINLSAPPKKKEIKKVPSIATKDEFNYYDKDLISNSEPSFFKTSMIKPNEKDNNSDISFENYPYDEQNQVYIDNLVKQKKMLENNYLQHPVEYEKFQKMELMRNSLYSPEDLEQKKYCNSCEDIYFPKDFKDKNGINKNKVGEKGNKKNNKITKLLGGESLFDDENDSYKNNLSDNNEQNKLNNFKNNNKDKIYNNINKSLFKIEKEFEGNEQFLFPDGIYGKDKENALIDEDNNENIKGKKNKKNKNKIIKCKKLFEDNE